MATIDLGKIKQVWRGTYNNGTAYTVDDLVAYTDGTITSTYICVANSTGNAPSSGGTAHASWNYVAKGVVDPIPSQSGNSGKFLKTNGSALSFDTAGKILQIKTVSFIPGTVSGTGDTFHDVSAGNIDITPVAAGSKFILTITGINAHVNMTGSTGNHGCRFFFGMNINSAGWVSATTGQNFNTSDEEPLACSHIQGDLGNYFDFDIGYHYVASPTYSLGNSISFRPYYGKNYAMGNSLNYYYQHNTQATKGDHRNNFTVMEVII